MLINCIVLINVDLLKGSIKSEWIHIVTYSLKYINLSRISGELLQIEISSALPQCSKTPSLGLGL